MNNCPACDSQRLHAPSDWEYHPYVHHGWNGSIWTHPDLENGTAKEKENDAR